MYFIYYLPYLMECSIEFSFCYGIQNLYFFNGIDQRQSSESEVVGWLIDQCQFMNQWLVRQKILLDLKSANLLKWRSRPGDWRWTTVRQMEGHRLVVVSAVDECSCSLFACSLHCPPWSYRWWPRGLCTCIQSRCCLAACVCSLLNASLSEIAVQGHSLEGAVNVLHCHLRDTALL